eukprot:jgi/Tetstr1/465552/TSEL_010221.t1
MASTSCCWRAAAARLSCAATLRQVASRPEAIVPLVTPLEELSRASTAQAVEGTVEAHLTGKGGEGLTAAQAAAVLQRLAQLPAGAGERVDPSAPFVASVLQRLRRAGPRELTSRERAAVVASLAQLQSGSGGIGMLLEALVSHALGSGLRGQDNAGPWAQGGLATELTALLTAHAQLNHRPRTELLQHANALLLSGAATCVGGDPGPELRSLAESAAALGGSIGPELLEALAAAGAHAELGPGPEPDQRAGLLWEAASLAAEAPRAFAALLQPLKFQLARLRAEGLQAVGRAPLALPPSDDVLLRALEADMGGIKGDLSAPALCDAAWAFATLEGGRRPALFDLLGRELLARPGALPSLSNGSLVRLLWAFGQARHPAHDLFTAAVPELLKRKLSLSALAEVLWAYARVGHRTAVLYNTAERMLVRSGGNISAHALAAMVWGFGHSGFWSPPVLHLAQQQVQRRLPEFQPCDLAQMCSGFAATRCDAPILLKIAEESLLHQRLLLPTQRLGPADTVDALVAFATMYRDRPQLVSYLREQALLHAREYAPPQRVDAIWALAVLGALDSGSMRLLAQGLPSGAPGDPALPDGFERLHLAEAAAKDQRGVASTRGVLPNGLRTLARRRWIASAALSDGFQQQVVGALGRLGLRCHTNHRTSDGTLLVEILAEDPSSGRQWGFKLNRRRDYARSRARAATAPGGGASPVELGGARLLTRLLESRLECGVIVVPFFEWDAARGQADAEEELLARLLVASGSQ